MLAEQLVQEVTLAPPPLGERGTEEVVSKGKNTCIVGQLICSTSFF